MLTERISGARLRLLTAVMAAGLVVASVPASAQSSRTELIRSEEAARAASVTPPKPNRGERLAAFFDGPAASGVVPVFGGLVNGAGANLGAAYRHFFGDSASWTAKGVYSIRQFFLLEGSMLMLGLAGGRLAIEANAAWNQGPRVEFYGIGPESLERRRSFHFERRLDAGVQARFRPTRLIVVGGGVDTLGREAGPTRGGGRSIETVFASDEAPGLDADVRYGHVAGSAGLDWRNAAGYADRGGLVQVALHTFRDPGRRYSFDRVDTEVVQHFPILRANWIISVRGRLSTVEPRDGQAVPFFMLPRTGGSSGVRGYSSSRFRDRSAALASAEYRWTPGEALEMAVFYDVGAVASRTGDLRLRDRHDSWGIGTRFHSPANTVLRLELAFGREGPHAIFSLSPAF